MHRKLGSHYPSPVPPPVPQCRKRTPRTGAVTTLSINRSPSEPRLLCSDLLTLRLEIPGGGPRDVDAVLEEISTHTASLQFEEAIPVGTRVRFLHTESAEGGNLTGTVVESLHHPNLGHFTEVQFVPGCTWSSKVYRPLHLFDPAGLLAMAKSAGGEA